MKRVLAVVLMGVAVGVTVWGGPVHAQTAMAPAEDAAASAQSEQLRRAMLDAAERGDAPAIYRIVSAGGSVNVADEALRSPLYMAVMKNHLDAVKELLSEGANINARARDLATPWLLAAGLGRTEMLRLMSSHHPDEHIFDRFGDTALSAACEGEYADTVRFLLTLPVDVNHRNTLGWTCLIEIAFVSDGGKKQQEIAQLVLAAGADPKIADADGMTALQHAEARKLGALVAILRAGPRGQSSTGIAPARAEPKAAFQPKDALGIHRN